MPRWKVPASTRRTTLRQGTTWARTRLLMLLRDYTTPVNAHKVAARYMECNTALLHLHSRDQVQLVSLHTPSIIPRLTMIAHHGVDSTTPQHRTTLPGAHRQAVNRSAIPLSTSRAEVRTQHSQYSAGHGSSLRHQLNADGSVSKKAHASPGLHGGGILSVMKVGRAGTAGEMGSQGHRMFQRDGSTFAKSGPLYH